MILRRFSPGIFLKKSSLLILIPLALSAFTHIWNPVGFPYVYIDEDVYLQRATLLLEGHGFRDTLFNYDHPYFGQIFLASIFKIIGYPDSLIPWAAQGDVHAIEMIYLVPRVLMGLLAVVDTFLLYKISENRYDRRIALFASVLFAVMPITWLIRSTLLDSILLPFLLSSILFALYTTTSKNTKNTFTLLLSGIFLGLAIFTKLTVFAMIPLVAFIIYQKNKNLKLLSLWLMPVILLPLIWPIHALYIGELNMWLQGMYFQSHRPEEQIRRHVEQEPLINSIDTFFKIDPILLILGTAGLIFAAIKKNLVLLLWTIPYLIFLYYLGFVQYFYLIQIVPPLCVATAILINQASITVGKKIQRRINDYFMQLRINDYFSHRSITSFKDQIRFFSKSLPDVIPFIIISVIAIQGLISTSQMITTNQNTSTFNAIAVATKYLSGINNDSTNYNYKNNLTVISDIRYLWILEHLLYKDFNYKQYWDRTPIKTQKVFWILDDEYYGWISTDGYGYGKQVVSAMQKIYNNTFPISEFSGNDTVTENRVPSKIQIRTNL